MRSSFLLFVFILTFSRPLISQDYLPLADTSNAGITDLVLIYLGGTHRPEWTVDDFRPYVFRKSTQESPEWLFDGFLFIEFKDNRGYEYAQGYNQKPAGKIQWEWLLNRNFEKDKAVDALNDLLDSLARHGHTPLRKRKVVLTLPEPISGFGDWGSIDGERMDFADHKHRLSACRWYIDLALEYWRDANPGNLELAGFYWVAEHSAEAAGLLPFISEYLHKKKLKFFWIPYWKANGAADWEDHGFDCAYQQPNHFFNAEIPDTRLSDAISFARTHGMGLEFEFDNRAKQPGFRKRFYSYIDSFRQYGIWDHVAVAYYEGGTAVMNFARSEESEIRKMYDVLAGIIIRRQQKTDRLLEER